MKPEPRRAILALAAKHDVALVATGHLHMAHDNQVDRCRYVWGGSAGFVVGPSQQPPMPGQKRLGAVVYDFDGPEVAITQAEVPGLELFWIDDVLHEVYPPRPAA